MLIGNVLEQLDKSNWKLVIDLCAAPGGKTTHMLSKLKEDVLIIANEVVATRLGSLKQNLIKWGYGNAVATMYSVENLANSGVKSDLLLVDAPCSGEGMF
jgi:16S rRNA C967 or C1407 C5-methylase (RsmB/RsmF family)